MIWGCSSVGRTPPLHGGSRRFESCQLHYHPTFVVNARAVLQANSRPPRWVAHNYVVVPEWLRGWIANPLFVGSIPTHHSKKCKIFLYFRIYINIYYCGGSLIGKTFRFHRKGVGSTPTHRSTFLASKGYLTIEN